MDSKPYIIEDDKKIAKFVSLINKINTIVKNIYQGGTGYFWYKDTIMPVASDGQIPHIISIEIKPDATLVKPIKEILTDIDFSCYISIDESLELYETRNSNPIVKIEFFEESIKVYKSTGLIIEFKNKEKLTEKINERIDFLYDNYDLVLSDIEIPKEDVMNNFGGRSKSNAINLEIDKENKSSKIIGIYDQSKNITMLFLQKHLLGFEKKKKKVKGESVEICSDMMVSLYERKNNKEMACIGIKVDSSLFVVEQLYMIYVI